MSDLTLPEQIAQRLRRDILRGVLVPGSPLKERDSAAHLGVSRTPMREAIRILAQEGLVILRPARSPVIADPSVTEVSDDLTVIRSLEVLSARLACLAASPEELSEIAGLLTEMEQSFETLDPLDFFELDMRFHRAIALASGNRSLAATHGEYLGRLWRARYLAARLRRNRDRVLRHHGDILAGLQARDPDRAEQAVATHLRDLVANIADVFDERGARAVERP